MFRVHFVDGEARSVRALDEGEAIAAACILRDAAPADVDHVHEQQPDDELPNPLALDWSARMAWYDGIAITMGLVALLVWMHTPPRCSQCEDRDAADLCDAYHLEHDERGWFWSKLGPKPWCAECADGAEEGGIVCVPAGAEPHLLPAERAALRRLG